MSELELKTPKNARVEDENEIEIDLLELVFRLIEKWKMIVAGALAGFLLMFVYSFILATPMYEATSKLYVLSSSDSAINLSDLQIGSYLTSDYMEVFEIWEVHEIVRQNLQITYTNEELEEMLTISNPGDTRILYITVAHEDPQFAAALANEYAAVAKRYISAVMLTDEPSLFSEAQVPDEPVSPRKALNVVLGFMLGAFIVCAVVVVQFLMDDKIKSEEDVRKYVKLNTLAVVPDNVAAEKDARRVIYNQKKQKKR